MIGAGHFGEAGEIEGQKLLEGSFLPGFSFLKRSPSRRAWGGTLRRQGNPSNLGLAPESGDAVWSALGWEAWGNCELVPGICVTYAAPQRLWLEQSWRGHALILLHTGWAEGAAGLCSTWLRLGGRTPSQMVLPTHMWSARGCGPGEVVVFM